MHENGIPVRDSCLTQWLLPNNCRPWSISRMQGCKESILIFLWLFCSILLSSPCYSWNLACFPVYDVHLVIFFLGCDKLIIYIGVCLTKKQLFAVICSAGWRESCLIQEMVGISVVHMFGVKLQRKMVYNWWNVEWNSCRQLLITRVYL